MGKNEVETGAVGNALRGVPQNAMDAATPHPGTPRRAFPTAHLLPVSNGTG
jgi:hypothetical protein